MRLIFGFLLLITDSLAANEVVLDGKQVYQTNCALCHGSAGDGRGPASAAIKDPKPRNFLGEALKYGDTKADIFNTITNGVPNTAMPPWSTLSMQERRSVANYIFNLVEKRKKVLKPVSEK